MAYIKSEKLTIYYEVHNAEAEDAIVLLHGFTGTTKTWHEVIELLPKTKKIVTIDFVGHGNTSSPKDLSLYSMESHIELVKEVVKHLQLAPFHLIGYSMGGRVALSYAAHYKEDVASILLESASPGLQGEASRVERSDSDEQLATYIDTYGVESFINKWESIPLFASQKKLPEAVKCRIREERLSHSAFGLACSLRGLSTGKMPPMWEALATLEMPIVLVTGQFDQKFIEIANKMQNVQKMIKHLTVPEVGHAIHVENPEKFATIVKEMIF